MSAQSILAWVTSVTSDLLPGHSQTLAAPVAAARCERPYLATIGR